MLRKAALSLTKNSWHVGSGRSPDLASQTILASLLPAAFPISDQWRDSRQLESITVAGPCGSFTRFPILPEIGAPEAHLIVVIKI